MNTCTIVMYHYVRDPEWTRYPDIKSLRIDEFKSQLDYLLKNYNVVSLDDCLKARYAGEDLPPNAALLTFDDGIVDHFATVFPLLDAHGVQGVFFPPVKAIRDRELLDVHKIHHILGTGTSITPLVASLCGWVDDMKDRYNLSSASAYYARLASEGRYDNRDVVFVKRMLQHELPENARAQILEYLFKEYVGISQKTIANELYMTEDQLRCMMRHGMVLGVHGANHVWMDKLDGNQQKKEIEESLEFLQSIGANMENWVISYPYGRQDGKIVDAVLELGGALGFTATSGIARLGREGVYTLPRIDTNELPPKVVNF